MSSAQASGLQPDGIGRTLRFLLIAVIAFLTLVDLFATQVIIPNHTLRYRVSPATMGAAVGACTFGMAAASLLVALFSDRIDRRRGIALSLLILSGPTALLAWAPTVAIFATLRVVQGLCMATAFSLTLAYVGERMSGPVAASAFRAYVTGNVASNLIGRFISSGIAGHWGIDANFIVFALLNLTGAALVAATLRSARPMSETTGRARAPHAAVMGHLADPALRAGFLFGFCILFVFIGVFTYVNFELVGERFELSMMRLGAVYLVFLPSILTTPQAGFLANRIGLRRATWVGLGIALAGVGFLALPSLSAVLLGMALVAVGTFLAQALATGFISRAATADRAAASGLYLASYFSGGLVGAIVLGQVYMLYGWQVMLAIVAAMLAWAATLTRHFFWR